MATDILQLYQDYSVDYKTEGHKHCRPGWVNTPCPFCISQPGHEGYHLGATVDGSTFYCWRCGWHHPVKAVSALLRIRYDDAKKLMYQYLGMISRTASTAPKVRTKAHKHPTNTGPMQSQHKRYLEKRGFDPDFLEKEWGLLGTGPFSLLDKINYSYRILAPILWNGEEVTFQTRDITNKHPLRYLACPEDREIMKHKHILYGKQEKWTDTAICVEGITDVWRFGQQAICTFGIKFTNAQLRLIAGTFKRVAIVYDNEPQAIAQAKELEADLRFRGVDTVRETFENDPGSMKQDDADYIVKTLLTKFY